MSGDWLRGCAAVGRVVAAGIVALAATMVALGWPTGRAPLEDCPAAEASAAGHPMYRELALGSTDWLFRDREKIYGWTRRMEERGHGMQAVAAELARAVGFAANDPIFREAARLRAGAPILELMLIGHTATAFGLTLCEADRLVPDSGRDSLATATEKLERLRMALQ